MTERPVGVSLLIWLFWFWAGAAVLLVLGLAIGTGPVMVNGRAMPRAEALATTLPALAPMALAVMGAALALLQRRRWARPAALFPFALAGFAPVLAGVDPGVGDLAVALLVLGPSMAAVAWYLYRWPGPRSYFDDPDRP